MSDSESRNYRRGIAAQALGLASTVGIQLGQVPILLAYLGAETYGEFIALVAIPAFFVLFDGGLLGASSTHMLHLLASGDDRGAARVSRATVTVVIMIVSTLATIVALISTIWKPLLSHYDVEGSATLVFALYSSFALLNFFTSTIEGALRAAGHYPFGWTFTATARLVEFAAAATSLALTGSLAVFCATLVFTRASAIVVFYIAARRRAPWFRMRPGPRALEALRPIRSGMAGTFLQPIANVALASGPVLVVSAALGPSAVVAYSTSRTLVNTQRQVASIVLNARLPGLTTKLAQGHYSAARALYGAAVRSVAVLTLATTVGLVLLGDTVLVIWTGGVVSDSRPLVYLLILASVVEVAWLCTASWFVARNLHFRITSGYLAAAIITVLATWSIMPAPVWSVPAIQAGFMALGLLTTLGIMRIRKRGD